ncbi:hypothetical protein K4L44_11770 [Halosquirtibacter laminarini]|uniref:Uncharacterized protein n=1 Tax=Halosquirtibacter laminarini TaxID=3374600 RepID=A0AC61NLV1_9BACT|nr:hypothetical protein K4L44_11770 [Prolixibacteraceae bacterium]
MCKYILLFVFGLLIISNTNASTDKEIHFRVNKNAFDSIALNLEYGNVVFYETTNDSLLVDVRITMDNIAENKANKELEDYDVLHHINDGLLSISQTRGQVTNTVRKYRFNYRIGVPTYCPLSIKMIFSKLNMDSWPSSLNIDATYCQINLLNQVGTEAYSKVKMKFDYCDINSDTIYQADVVQKGGIFNVKYIKEATIDAKQAKVSLGYFKGSKIKSKECVVTVDSIDNVRINANQSFISLHTITSSLSLYSDLSTISLGDIVEGGCKLNLDIVDGDLHMKHILDSFSEIQLDLMNAMIDDNLDLNDYEKSTQDGSTIYHKKNTYISIPVLLNLKLQRGTLFNE